MTSAARADGSDAGGSGCARNSNRYDRVAGHHAIAHQVTVSHSRRGASEPRRSASGPNVIRDLSSDRDRAGPRGKQRVESLQHAGPTAGEVVVQRDDWHGAAD